MLTSVSCHSSTTLANAAFLCSVLLEDPESRHLAFCVGLFSLEMARPPAATKSLEVTGGFLKYFRAYCISMTAVLIPTMNAFENK